jgi:hypothetical protein
VTERTYALESQYAIVFQPHGREAVRPTPRHVYQRLEAFVRKRCSTLPTRDHAGVFLENGGLLQFEGDLDEGVIQVTTPECRSARQAVIYQEAMDALLSGILPDLNARLRLEGYEGVVVLGRNTTDNKGHFYESQEHYAVSGARRAWYLRPLMACFTALFTPLQAVAGALPMVPLLFLLGVSRLGALLLRARPAVAQRWSERCLRWTEKVVLGVSRSAADVLSPLVAWYVALVSNTVYAPYIGELTAFIVTRPIWCGSGRLKMPASPGQSPFQLMQKSDAMGAVTGVCRPGVQRPIYDFKSLFTHPMAVLRPVVRLQVCYSDSNMSEQISWLKLAVTGLLLQMIEDGIRFDVRLASPMQALRRVSADVSLERPVAVVGRGEVTALSIQAHYLEVARQYFEVHPGDGSAARILGVWEELLRSVAQAGQARPVWTVDWSAKRALMAEALCDMASIEDLALVRTWAEEIVNAGENFDVLSQAGEVGIDLRLRTVLTARAYVTLNHYRHARRLLWADFLKLLQLSWQVEKIDLKYHQVGSEGYAHQLVEGGLMPRMSCAQELRTAQTVPPGTARPVAAVSLN